MAAPQKRGGRKAANGRTNAGSRYEVKVRGSPLTEDRHTAATRPRKRRQCFLDCTMHQDLIMVIPPKSGGKEVVDVQTGEV